MHEGASFMKGIRVTFEYVGGDSPKTLRRELFVPWCELMTAKAPLLPISSARAGSQFWEALMLMGLGEDEKPGL
jgi:hypothetical protein